MITGKNDEPPSSNNIGHTRWTPHIAMYKGKSFRYLIGLRRKTNTMMLGQLITFTLK